MSTTESLNSASCRAGVYSQLHQTRPRTITLQHDLTQDDYGLALCLRVILDSEAHRWVQAGHPRYTGARKGRPWVVHNRRPQTNDRQTTTFLGQTCFEANKYRQTCCQRRQVLTDTCVLTFLLNLFFFLNKQTKEHMFSEISRFFVCGENLIFLTELTKQSTLSCILRRRTRVNIARRAGNREDMCTSMSWTRALHECTRDTQGKHLAKGAQESATDVRQIQDKHSNIHKFNNVLWCKNSVRHAMLHTISVLGES